MKGCHYVISMKMKVTFKPLRSLVSKPVRVINNGTRIIVRPVSKLKSVIWHGLKVHSGTPERFRERLLRRMTAPFHFALPSLKSGKM